MNVSDAPALAIMASGLVFPEGPNWLPDGSVLVSEIIGGTIARCWPDGRVERLARTGGGPNGMAIGPDGALYVCNNGGMKHERVASRGWILPGEQPDDYSGGSIQRVDLASGEVSTIYTHCDERPLAGPNDIVFDAEGHFWFTDHGKIRDRTRDRGGIYHASIDGRSIREAVFPLDAPNGIGLSHDGDCLYVAESFTARVWSFEVSGPGSLRTRPHARVHGARLLCGLPGYHLFDSLAVDTDGNVCVATLGDACGITVVSPEAGAPRHIALPGPMPTNLCFGGVDGRQAFATLSPQGELATWVWSSTVSPILEGHEP